MHQIDYGAQIIGALILIALAVLPGYDLLRWLRRSPDERSMSEWRRFRREMGRIVELDILGVIGAS